MRIIGAAAGNIIATIITAQIAMNSTALIPRLILFHDGQVIASIPMHTGTPLLLGMHGIGTDDPPFHQRRVNESRRRTDFILFAPHRSLRQDDATLAFVEGEQVH
jgi:hypothetical protein